ncbi:hypothetical protein AK812_SmicGene44365, partial [Symbiodinium microadriaticum]
MSAREKLLALRARCKGSRAKTYTNAYRAAWKTGEVTEDPEAVYLRIKNKHLMFGESREEREVRIDGEHQALVKGRLSGHQFEPLFEASVADLESVGLGKTPRELYLSYLRKMPPHLQKEIRRTSGSGLETPKTWVSVPRRRGKSATKWCWSTSSEKRLTAQKEIRELKAAAKAAAARTAPWRPAPAPRVAGKEQPARSASISATTATARRCPFSHDKELRKQALAAKRGESTLAAKGGKGGGKGGGKAGATAKAKPKAKPKAAAKAAPKPPGTVCPFFQKTGSCRKGANCDMVHSLLAGQGQALPANWGPPSGASMSNPFAAFSIQIGSSGVQAGLPVADSKGAVREHALALKKGESGRFAALDELPGDWWSLAENEPGGYRYRTVVQVLGRRVECMLDGCAGANHVTEELLVGMLNRAAELGIGTEDPRFPVVKLEKWVHPEFVHGIASGAPVPLKGAAVLRVTLLEGKTPEEARAGPEIFVRCKIAARGSSDWHGLILGGRALDCASRMGGAGCFEPGGTDRELLR